MAFFSVGDRVTVRSDLGGKIYYMENGSGYVTISEMLNFVGKKVTISDVFQNGYRINEFPCFWTDEMFEEYVYRNDEPGDSAFDAPPETELMSLFLF